MKIAVTGCNGSVGQRVVLRALQAHHTVVGIDIVAKEDTEYHHDPHFTFVHANLTDYEEVLKALEGCDAIVQLAAIREPLDYKVKTHNCNVVISWNVLRAAAEVSHGTTAACYHTYDQLDTCSHLGIDRVAQASSANVLRGIYSVEPQFDYFPIDELHPTLPDEPYGLSKLIAEMQADTITRRYPNMRVASLRLHWSIASRAEACLNHQKRSKGDLWCYVQEDSSADAFVRAVAVENDKWKGHESFFIVAPQVAADEGWLELKHKYFPDVPVRDEWVENEGYGFFDCRKAERFIGWVHSDHA